MSDVFAAVAGAFLALVAILCCRGYRAPYRLRTKLRGRLPWVLSERVPKGRDCGEGRHERYLVEDGLWGCYHCVQDTHESPWQLPREDTPNPPKEGR